MNENYEFNNIIGYDDVKREVSEIIKWYKEKRYLNNNLRLPKGILFYGAAGCGKTLFVSEIVKAFDTKTIEFKGSTVKDVLDVFKKAKEAEFSIIVIDEIDLITRDSAIIRALQSEMDGMDKANNILVLATTNDLDDIPNPLLRNGRFDKKIGIKYPSLNDRKKMLEHYFDKYNIKADKLIIDFYAEQFSYITCVDIESICNDVAIRYPGVEVNEQILLDAYSRVIENDITLSYDKSLFRENIAIHEIGHALITYLSKTKKLISCSFGKTSIGGVSKSISEDSTEAISDIEGVKISIAGYAAENLFNYKSNGSSRDLVNARGTVAVLINKDCYYDIKDIMQSFSGDERLETEWTRKRFERKIRKTLGILYKDVYKTLKNHKEEIIKLKDIMMDKGYLSRNDFKEVVVC